MHIFPNTTRNGTTRHRAHEHEVFSCFFVENSTQKTDEKIAFWGKNSRFWDNLARTSLKIAHHDLSGRPAIILVAFRVDNTMAYVKSEKVTVDIEFSCFFSWKQWNTTRKGTTRIVNTNVPEARLATLHVTVKTGCKRGCLALIYSKHQIYWILLRCVTIKNNTLWK